MSYQGGKSPQPLLSWNARLLPYLEHGPLWAQVERAFAQEKQVLVNPPHSALGVVVPAFGCPADSRTLRSLTLGAYEVAFTAYLGVEGVDQVRKDGLLYLDSKTRLGDIRDGTSHTLLVGERPPSADGRLGWWYVGEGQSKDGSADMVLGVRELNANTYIQPCPPGPSAFGPGNVRNQCDALHFWSLHLGRGAHFVLADGAVRFIPYSAAPIMPDLATRSGGETVALPE